MSFLASLMAFSRLLLSLVLRADKYLVCNSSNLTCTTSNCSNLVIPQIKPPYDTQVQTFPFVYANHTTKNAGIHILFIRCPRPTTALSADEQN